MEDVRKFQFTECFPNNSCILHKKKGVITGKKKGVITGYTLFALFAYMSHMELHKKMHILSIQMSKLCF